MEVLQLNGPITRYIEQVGPIVDKILSNKLDQYVKNTRTIGVLDSLHEARASMLEIGVGDRNTVFKHNGPVAEDTIHLLLDLTERTSIEVGDPIGLRKRLFNVLVEGLENIQRHAEPEYNASAGAILVSGPSGYTMRLGNGMPVIMAAMMEHRLDLLNLMDDHDLKDHYLKLLSSDGRTERGGAGLGLMTIARKCTRPMKFTVRSVNESMVYAVLELNIARLVP